jgi:hypothetical protein
MTTTLDTPPIRLIRRTFSTSQTLGSLPIPTMGAVTQEPDAPTTEYKVAKTQEPVNHSVAETQEPAMAETQETAMAETQEPAADIEIELQELETQTSFVFEGVETQTATHLVAETQEPTTDFEIEEVETLGCCNTTLTKQNGRKSSGCNTRTSH